MQRLKLNYLINNRNLYKRSVSCCNSILKSQQNLLIIKSNNYATNKLVEK